jgi:7-carboxy-7-deazaguanine synthase
MNAVTATRAPVLEAFASIQGEGRYIGQPQVFLRLRGCPLRCAWCDTPGSWNWRGDETARIAAPSGERLVPALADARDVAAWIDELDPSGRMPVSLTGGEPLIWPDFLLALKPQIGARRLHLETAGAHPGALETVRDACDHLSIDLKLPADMRAPVELEGHAGESTPSDEPEWHTARRAVLQLATGRDACLKLVVAGERSAEEYAPLIADARELAPDLLLIVQPATPIAGVGSPAQAVLDQVVEQAAQAGFDVRLLPQLHRLLGLD